MNDLQMYKYFRPEMGTFDLLNCAGTGPWSQTIMSAMQTDYSHSAVVFRMPFYELERLWVIEAVDEGLVLRSLSAMLSGYKGRVTWHKVQPENKIYTREAALWLLERVDKPESAYDWLGCISHWRTLMGLPPREAKDGRLWCTEAIFLALRDGARHPDCQHLNYAPLPGLQMLEYINIWDPMGVDIL